MLAVLLSRYRLTFKSYCSGAIWYHYGAKISTKIYFAVDLAHVLQR
jgi:hypothetical protein